MTPYRLFWKLFFAFWAAMVLSFFGAVGYVALTGLAPPPGDDDHWWRLIVPLASGALTSVPASLLLAWYLTRPLRHVRWALDQIAGGRFETRVRAQIGSRSDEIADLAGYLDDTAERLQRLEASRRQLLHDISHELRSPLSRLRAAIGLARTDLADVPTMLERVDREAERLNGLLGELLTLSRLEAGATGLRRDRIDLIELVLDIAADADFEARALGRSLDVRAEGSFIAVVDGDLIYRALENVVRNAVKYTAEGSCVDVRARPIQGGERLEVAVLDRGPGVPADMLDLIFEPFVRGPAGRGPASGFGLGLAIARRAVLAHDGQIFAHPRDGGGLQVTIRLPSGLQPERAPGGLPRPPA